MATGRPTEVNMTEQARERSPKRRKLEPNLPEGTEQPAEAPRVKGVAAIKPEYQLTPGQEHDSRQVVDDDAAEAAPRDARAPSGAAKREKNRGQNKNRKRGADREANRLCTSRATQPEFSPLECRFGDKCRLEHDLRKYLEQKRADLDTFDGRCPVWDAVGSCPAGWRCRFVGSHMEERETTDKRKELCLIGGADGAANDPSDPSFNSIGIVNALSAGARVDLNRKKYPTPKADRYLQWLVDTKSEQEQLPETEDFQDAQQIQDHRATFTDPPLLPSEKRRVYFGPETPALAPLTTQGNLPFRRLCVEFGAQLTYSEMALGLPLIQGSRQEWALLKAHESERQAPILSGNTTNVVEGYDPSKDMRFGAQIAGNKPWNVLKATEMLTNLCPHLRVVDLNCGCPIDLVYRQGAGSALLDTPSKLEKMLSGMNATSGEVPITVKIRMGTKDGKPTAEKLVERLVYGSKSQPSGSGIAAITLHGRSRQQRYTRRADWEYIAECAAIVKKHRENGDTLADTVREADARYSPASGQVYFLGNGDCYSHIDYQEHLEKAKVDTVMVGRGALVKPWLFEEIAAGQYLDKSASERLEIVKKYVQYGFEAWGTDEMGLGQTRRFLLEWLSFAHRYVPLGILEHLPPSLQDRPQAWRGRNEMETLLASGNYKDWIKISEIFLGPAGDNFVFEPKHKSNSYEIEAEG